MYILIIITYLHIIYWHVVSYKFYELCFIKKFKESSLAMNHLFVTVKTRFDESTRWLTSDSVIMTVVSSASRTGVGTEFEGQVINIQEKKE